MATSKRKVGTKMGMDFGEETKKKVGLHEDRDMEGKKSVMPDDDDDGVSYDKKKEKEKKGLKDKDKDKAREPGYGGHQSKDKVSNVLKKGNKKAESKADDKDKERLMKAKRAGVQFPIGRTHRNLKGYVSRKMRVGSSCAVYVSSVMEYLAAEVLELAGNAAKSAKVKRVTPRHIQLAIRGDEELNGFIKATIAGGGVVPHIHEVLKTSKRPRNGNVPDDQDFAMDD